MKSFILICLFSLNAIAQSSGDAVLSSFKPGQLGAVVSNKEELELISAKKSWLIKGQQYEQDFDADAAIEAGHIVCSFYIPSKQLKFPDYRLYYSERYEDINANHLEFNSGSNFFGMTCFKNQSLTELTVNEVNQAFGDLIKFDAVTN